MQSDVIEQLKAGMQTAYLDRNVSSNLAYKPQFISNNYQEGRKVLSSIESELLSCKEFSISVAFITMGGITPLLQTLKELEMRGIPGRILTTDYLNFSDPKALKRLAELDNLTVKMYRSEAAGEGFHTKGYIFKKEEIYRIIVGSSNMTLDALTKNREWNSKIVSTEQGEYTEEIVSEFEYLWNSQYTAAYEDFIDTYTVSYEVQKKQRQIARQAKIPSIEQYKLKPNSMQTAFIANLKKIYRAKEQKALLISATATGKTYASAFAMRELGFHRVLFLVHRGQLARQTKESYEKVFGTTVSMGLVGAGYSDYDADYIFATVQTLNREEHLRQFEPTGFECIILDEAHHSSANSYQKIMQYFQPKLWLGMTATPDRRDDDMEGRNIYEIFNHQIAYEIRLQQAMEEDLLCPFHYFGISDLSVIGDEEKKPGKLSSEDFRLLTSDERVRHIVEQANYYGYSGDRVKGLVFCSRIDESRELSEKFNALGYRTIALNGDAPEEKRVEAFERLAMDGPYTADKDKADTMGAEDSSNDLQPLDYIFSVDILNEGVDIVEINQVIMLRPTESPIVFIQQLGRGLRKAPGKEYVVILDFIGNYKKNFMIPIALSGDRTYNADTIRKYVISGNNVIPGASTVHFDAVAKEKIFHSIDKMSGIKAIIRESYASLKNRLGRIPYLTDFYESGEVDPLVIIREYKTYSNFLASVETNWTAGILTEQEKLTLEYLSKTILSGVRPYELEIMKRLSQKDTFTLEELESELEKQYHQPADRETLDNAVKILQGDFVSKEEERQKYSRIEIVRTERAGLIQRMKSYETRLEHAEFAKQVNDLVSVGLQRYSDRYGNMTYREGPFVLYEKYSRRDICLLMNLGADRSSVMYGKYRIDDDVFIFITYHKDEAADESKLYADGKPDYADAFADNMTFLWDSQIGKGPDSSYMREVIEAERKHLLVKKSDAETSFYYMGTFDIDQIVAAKKKDNNGKERDITKVRMRMHHAVRDDLLRYLESKLETEE